MSFRSASMDWPALYSWAKPRMAFRMTMAAMTAASSASPMAKETMAAAMRRYIRKLLNWLKKRMMGEVFFRALMTLGPYFFRRSAASPGASPEGFVESLS